jgi:hypothetical protein
MFGLLYCGIAAEEFFCMKNTIKLLGIIALAAVIGFSMAACSDDSGGDDNSGSIGTVVRTELEGEWKSEWSGGNHITYAFSGSNYLCSYAFPDENRSGWRTGTFSSIGTTITFAPIWDSYGYEMSGWTQNYTLAGNALSLSGGGYAFKGVFTKVNSGGAGFGGDAGWSNTVPSDLPGVWKYKGKELFSIEANATGTISGEGGYSVQTRPNSTMHAEVRFKNGNTVTGQFIYYLNGDGDMWIVFGTGPFTAWTNLGIDPKNGRYYFIGR